MKITILPIAIERFKRSIETVYPEASDRFVEKLTDRVFNHIDLLSRYPNLGSLEPALEKFGLAYRRLIIGHFKIIYRVFDQEILVLDIFDSRQDPDRMRM